MKDLRVTIVQTKLFWENARKNLEHIQHLLKNLKKNSTDLILLPEMFSTGFSMNAQHLAEEMSGESVEWMRDLAKKKNTVVCGGLIIKEKGKFFNRLVWMSPDGTFKKYDKRHLFRMAEENNIYSQGKEKLIIDYKNWSLFPLICYDLRFPVWSRNESLNQRYDVLIYVANWPNKRAHAWKQLLIARAIENQCYVIGVNRIGKDGNGILYSGDSVVIDPMGKRINSAKSGKETVETVILSKKQLDEYRKLFPVLLDADDFEIKA